ncbi:MAG: hypothetical protein U0165_07180 [Polyangiaceae bacterium]
MRSLVQILPLVLVGSIAVSCSSSDNPTSSFGSTGGTAGTSTAGSAGAAGSIAGTAGTSGTAGSSGSAGSIAGTGGTGGTSSLLRVYGSTDTSLYAMDPETLAIENLGDFDCIGTVTGQYAAMTDIAVNAQGEIWGLSAHFVHLLEVQSGKVHCAKKTQLKGSDARFYALSFAPVGVLDPAKEVLVAGNTAGELWSISDLGDLVLRGNFGNVPADDGHGHTFDAANVGQPWQLSGDIVFFSNNNTPVGFATVRDCPTPNDTTGCNYTNTLLQIDVTALSATTPGSVTQSVRGQIVPKSTCNTSGWGNFWGVAAWNEHVFGFFPLGRARRYREHRRHGL